MERYTALLQKSLVLRTSQSTRTRACSTTVSLCNFKFSQTPMAIPCQTNCLRTTTLQATSSKTWTMTAMDSPMPMKEIVFQTRSTRIPYHLTSMGTVYATLSTTISTAMACSTALKTTLAITHRSTVQEQTH